MDTKKALLDSAEIAVRSAGYDGFSYAHLAEDVGIRKASIHYHFPSKADLALELMKRYNLDMQAQLEAIDEAAGSAGQRLRGQINRYRVALDEGRLLCLCIALSISTSTLDDTLVTELRTFRAKSVDWLTSVFEAAAEDNSIKHVNSPKAEARACLAALEGAHLAARAEKDMRRFDEAIELLLQRID